MPNPLTRPSFASLTCRAPASPVSWRIASTRPRKPPAAPAWPTESCPPEVLCGTEPSCVKRVPADEGRGRVLLAEAEVLQLHRDDHRVVIVGLHEIHVGRARAGLGVELVAVERPAAAHLDRDLRRTRYAFRWFLDMRKFQVQFPRAIFFRKNEKPLGPGAGHDAIEKMQRVRDRPRGEVLLHRKRLLEQGVRELERVGALRDAQLAEVLARRAALAHVVRGEEREAGIRAAGAVRVDGVARELAEVGERQAEGIDVVGVAGEAGDDARVARLHRARRAPQRHHAARAAQGNVVEPARREAEVLREADGRVGLQREAGNGEPIDFVLFQF